MGAKFTGLRLGQGVCRTELNFGCVLKTVPAGEAEDVLVTIDSDYLLLNDPAQGITTRIPSFLITEIVNVAA